MNHEDFTSRVENNRQTLLAIARSMIRPGDCEDAVQSAILSAWAHLPQLRDEQAFDAWLRWILINRCRQIQRAYKRENELKAALAKDEAEKEMFFCLAKTWNASAEIVHSQRWVYNE